MKNNEFQQFELFETTTTKKNYFVISRVKKGLGWSSSNRGDEGSMCHFKEIDFGLIFIWEGSIKGLKMVLE